MNVNSEARLLGEQDGDGARRGDVAAKGAYEGLDVDGHFGQGRPDVFMVFARGEKHLNAILCPVQTRVLVVSASMGAGHDGAARELVRRLKAEGHEAEMRDFLTCPPLRIGVLLRVQLRVPDEVRRLDLRPHLPALVPLARPVPPDRALHGPPDRSPPAGAGPPSTGPT